MPPKTSMAWGGRNQSSATDFYETPEGSVKALLDIIQPMGAILEPCNGRDGIGKFLPPQTFKVDIDPQMIADRYGDFLTMEFEHKFDYIICNPPFNQNTECQWALKCLRHLNSGGTLAIFCKLLWVEIPKRRPFFKAHPPKSIHVFSERQVINGANGVCYAWFIWQDGYEGPTTFHWI